MKSLAFLVISSLLLSIPSISSSQSEITIKDYNQALPYWGTSWSPGPAAVSMYYPSFYTGFAMRTQYPERLHLRLARGNQTRISVILDEQTLSDYLFDLVKRYEFYKKIQTVGITKRFVSIPADKNTRAIAQLDYYSKIIESSAYGILPFVERAKLGNESAQSIYSKSLRVLSELNLGRVFKLRLNLTQEFLKWKSQIQQTVGTNENGIAQLASDPKQAVVAINSLLWGRINYVQKPTPEILQKLLSTATLAVSSDETLFLNSALELFKLVTGNKYDIQVVGAHGQWESALQCANVQKCYLSYPEFTTIYPTGSVMASTRDQFGNQIHTFSTPGLWNFHAYGGGRDVDNIRDEPYYGWIPKMDYEAVGNGYHNPAVRFYGPSADTKKMLGVPTNHNILWTVKRGDVSHGCSRLSSGHIWELRHIFPVQNEKMIQVKYFGNRPQDFDLFDIDGDGQLEVMGVEYFISYGLQGTDNMGRREGVDMQVNADHKLEFYTSLYGAQKVFTVVDGIFVFENPTTSVHSYLDAKRKTVTTLTLNGQYKLYEQSYERDKLQLYSSFAETNSPTFKRVVRLLGRVRGCAPTSNKNECGEAAFDAEAAELLNQLQ
ncbi:MAG: hypothetical protein SGI74_13995 [Oligoflexia bacterium]|nr:hypothetical protein [Oligoflexia bacterium]